MRVGYTTGACGAAGVKACLALLIEGLALKEVSVRNPRGEMLVVPVEWVRICETDMAEAVIIKDGGDDPDITHGMPVVVRVKLEGPLQFSVEGGEGVGRITKEGLGLPIGSFAINQGPREMMEHVYEEYQSRLKKGVHVILSLPHGKALAPKTLNPQLGIEGGLSIIGTTGIVRPMSEEAFKDSLAVQLDVISSGGHRHLILTPGDIGKQWVYEHGGPKHLVAETSNFIGYMLRQAVDKGFTDVLVVGHIGKLIKIASGSFQTHSQYSDARMETLAAYAAVLGAKQTVISEILESVTTEAVLDILSREGLEKVYAYAAMRAEQKAFMYARGALQVGIIYINREGQCLAQSQGASEIMEKIGWQKSCMSLV